MTSEQGVSVVVPDPRIGVVMAALDEFHVLAGRVTQTQAAHVLKRLDELSASPAGSGQGPSDLKGPDTQPGADGAVVVYIDCEFDGHDGPLLSIALVKQDGDSIHIQTDVEPTDLWVRQHVMPIMDAHRAAKSVKVYHNEVGGVIRAFLAGTKAPVIVADSPVDIGRFCRALSTGPDGGWASGEYSRMTFEVHNVDCYPTSLVGAVQHNAWWDAMALRDALSAATTDQRGGDEAKRSEPDKQPAPAPVGAALDLEDFARLLASTVQSTTRDGKPLSATAKANIRRWVDEVAAMVPAPDTASKAGEGEG